MFKIVSVVLQVSVYYKGEEECCWNNNKNKNNYNTAINLFVMYLNNGCSVWKSNRKMC